MYLKYGKLAWWDSQKAKNEAGKEESTLNALNGIVAEVRDVLL